MRPRPWWILALATTGCLHPAFPPPPSLPADLPDPAGIPARFASRLDPSFEQLQSTVFRFGFREIAALGYARVDRPARTFAVACFTPLGVKIFEVSGARGVIRGRFTLPDLESREDVVRAIGEDIQRAYFDLVPPAGAAMRRERGAVVFAAPGDGGVLEYRFAGPDGVLARKSFAAGGRTVWSVDYDVRGPAGAAFDPDGIAITNHRFRYRVVIRRKPMDPSAPGRASETGTNP